MQFKQKFRNNIDIWR